MSEGGRKEVLTGRGENCSKRKDGRVRLAEREAGASRVLKGEEDGGKKSRARRGRGARKEERVSDNEAVTEV